MEFDYLRMIMREDDVEIVRGIPICKTNSKDKWLWHYTKNGIFSTKSAYKLFCTLSVEGSISNPDCVEVWWKNLWRLKIPNKIKIFMWRLAHNILPTNQNLNIRKVTDDPMCVCRGRKRETIEHTFFGCTRAREIWRLLLPQLQTKILIARPILDGLLLIQNLLKPREFELFCIACWALWFDRNKLRVHEQVQSAESRSEWIINYWEEVCPMNKRSEEERNGENSTFAWCAPSPNFAKLNVDAACHPRIFKTGLGAVLQNSSGQMVVARADPMDARLDPAAAEAMSILRGIQMASRAGISQLEIESDSLLVVWAISSNDLDCSSLGAIFSEIRREMSLFEACCLNHIPRKTNKVADKLAKWALSSESPIEWFENGPDWLESMLVLDLSSCSPMGIST